MKKPKRAKKKFVKKGMIASQIRLAEEIAVEFEIPCTKQNIQNWQRRCEPPFPRPLPNGSYDRKECFAWVKKFKASKSSKAQDELITAAFIAKSEREITKARREQLEFDKENEKFIDRHEARTKAIGAVRRYHSFVITELENNLPFDSVSKLKDAGATSEVTALFFDWITSRYQRAIDRIEKRCEDEEKELDAIAI